MKKLFQKMKSTYEFSTVTTLVITNGKLFKKIEFTYAFSNEAILAYSNKETI